jgi:hypothetical protein
MATGIMILVDNISVWTLARRFLRLMYLYKVHNSCLSVPVCLLLLINVEIISRLEL